MCFEDMSGLKINFHKSEVIVMGQPLEEQVRIANLLNCKGGSFPFIYLSLPISDRKLSTEQWLFLVRKLSIKIEPWLGKLLTSGGRQTLSNACLDNMPIFATWAFFNFKTGFMLSLTPFDLDSFGRAQGRKGSIIW
jgi:hypothetical protein